MRVYRERAATLVLDHVRSHGPSPTVELLRRLRSTPGTKRFSEQRFARLVDDEPLLVALPDGRVDHLLHVIEGSVFTQRVRASTAGRSELWSSAALLPILELVDDRPLPLGTGGTLSRGTGDGDVLVGPKGWLPEVGSWSLVGVRIKGGMASAVGVEDDEVADGRRGRDIRALLARHSRRERSRLATSEAFAPREPGVLTAVTYALLEDPTAFADPLPPLDELVHHEVGDRDQHFWRDLAAFRLEGAETLTLRGLPRSLARELRLRSQAYDMSLDQYVIAILGHLAWRTPFAEDLGPASSWLPDVLGPAVYDYRGPAGPPVVVAQVPERRRRSSRAAAGRRHNPSRGQLRLVDDDDGPSAS